MTAITDFILVSWALYMLVFTDMTLYQLLIIGIVIVGVCSAFSNMLRSMK